MKTLFALIAISLASPAMANCGPEFRGPLYIHTHEGDMKRAAECKLWDQKKIDRAYKLLGGKYSKAQLITWEMNEGKFPSAQALADWVKRGDSESTFAKDRR